MDTKDTEGTAGEARRTSLGAVSNTSRSSSYDLSAASSKSASKKGRSVEPDQSKVTAEKAGISSHTWKSKESSAAAARRPSISTETLKSLQSSSTGHTRHAHRESLGAILSADEEQPRIPSARPGSAQSFRSLRRSSVASIPVEDVNEAKSEPGQPRPSFSSSLLSLGTAIMSGIPGLSSAPSSVAGSDVGEAKNDIAVDTATTATSNISALGISATTPNAIPIRRLSSESVNAGDNISTLPSRSQTSSARPSRSLIPSSRRTSGLMGSSGTASPSTERGPMLGQETKLGIIGICALDAKARSKPSRNILNRINANNEFEVIIFGDKVILDEEAENWPICDYLISFFSEGFPLDKAIAYTKLRKPFSVNDLPMQKVLWDRRLCLHILDKWQVTTPERVEVNRDGGPTVESAEQAQYILDFTGISLPGPENGTGGGEAVTKEVKMIDDDTLSVDGVILKKPFVEKPTSGEDHNINIYYAGGGGRRLFRKINNKSSAADDTLVTPRSITEPDSSYIYEAFLKTENAEDVKAYTVGPDFCHAETRKSPVVDGIVKRNTHGKELRYVTSLTPEEAEMASKVSRAFGQRVCGFDMLRAENRSFVIDVNGWSFVKDNNDYYDKCANILRDMFIKEKMRREGSRTPTIPSELSAPEEKASANPLSALAALLRNPLGNQPVESLEFAADRGTLPLSSPPSLERPPTRGATLAPIGLPQAETPASTTQNPSPSGEEEAPPVPPPASKAQWRLKGMVAVIRHADRTPKQKLKFTFHTKPFVDLLKGHREEVLLLGENALSSVLEAVAEAQREGDEDPDKLRTLRTALVKKGSWPGTKVQIKPMFRKKPKHDEKAPHSPESPRAVPHPEKDTTTLSEREKQKRQDSLTGVTMSRVAAEEENLEIEKLQLIIKWGGEPTHSARYQATELGENLRVDMRLMNRDTTDNVKVFSSSERRVSTSAQIFTSAFMDKQDVEVGFVKIRKDLLDDSNAAKDEMDKVKKKLKGLLRKGNKAPSQFAWPENMPEPYIVAHNIVELMTFHRRVMRENFARLYSNASSSLAALNGNLSRTISNHDREMIDAIQPRWCSGEDPELFRERWEKLFNEFQDTEKVDPGRISELHDTIKFDALHNRQFLEWVFTPSPALLEEFFPTPPELRADNEDASMRPPQRSNTAQSDKGGASSSSAGTAPMSTPVEQAPSTFAERMGFRRKPTVDPSTLRATAADPAMESYFSLFGGGLGHDAAKSKADSRLEKLRELFLFSKILFDFIGPQEYGITDSEKLEIGLLTSLPLLRAIVTDLEDMQASAEGKSSFYFTKESHIYTLLNCIIEGGIETKIERNKIPELDYLSTIGFELYESQNEGSDGEEGESFNYSIRISISPGCHTFEPLDVALDSKHCIGFAQRRSLTAHNDWKHVIETLRAKFDTVKLPKSFVAINLSEKVPQAFQKMPSPEMEKRGLYFEQREGLGGEDQGRITPP